MKVFLEQRALFIASELREYDSLLSRQASFFVSTRGRANASGLALVDVARSPHSTQDVSFRHHLSRCKVDLFLMLIFDLALVCEVISFLVSIHPTVTGDPLQVYFCQGS